MSSLQSSSCYPPPLSFPLYERRCYFSFEKRHFLVEAPLKTPQQRLQEKEAEIARLAQECIQLKEEMESLEVQRAKQTTTMKSSRLGALWNSVKVATFLKGIEHLNYPVVSLPFVIGLFPLSLGAFFQEERWQGFKAGIEGYFSNMPRETLLTALGMVAANLSDKATDTYSAPGVCREVAKHMGGLLFACSIELTNTLFREVHSQRSSTHTFLNLSSSTIGNALLPQGIVGTMSFGGIVHVCRRLSTTSS
ncbi:MAG: hypothetical protein JWO53_106 [Chlamydiia bacterium]|nr:hypothetical protein [Chlamydiia bacterium]